MYGEYILFISPMYRWTYSDIHMTHKIHTIIKLFANCMYNNFVSKLYKSYKFQLLLGGFKMRSLKVYTGGFVLLI